jgi:hypothetical protein
MRNCTSTRNAVRIFIKFINGDIRTSTSERRDSPAQTGKSTTTTSRNSSTATKTVDSGPADRA